VLTNKSLKGKTHRFRAREVDESTVVIVRLLTFVTYVFLERSLLCCYCCWRGLGVLCWGSVHAEMVCRLWQGRYG